MAVARLAGRWCFLRVWSCRWCFSLACGLGVLFPFPFCEGADPKTGLVFTGIPLVTSHSWYAICSDVLGLWISTSGAFASAGHMVVSVVTGQMVGDLRFTGATILGSRSFTPSANHPVSVPLTGPEHSDASWCGQCTRWQVVYTQMGSCSRVCSGTSVHSTRGVAASFLTRFRGSRIFVFVALVIVCCCLNVTHSAPRGKPTNTTVSNVFLFYAECFRSDSWANSTNKIFTRIQTNTL